MPQIRFILVSCLFLLAVGPSRLASQPQEEINGRSSTDLAVVYRFENKRFYIPRIQIELGTNGSAALKFTRGESDEVLDRRLKLLPATISRIRELLEILKFFESSEQYQSKKDFSHLGWTTIQARIGDRERTVRFNYTNNVKAQELADIFRGLATQEIHLLDLENAAQYQPLDLPKQIEYLADDLRLERVTEPVQLLPALKELAGNDVIPAIARSQASLLIANIEKNKYKSPIKRTP
jgi:hypothetical protein